MSKGIIHRLRAHDKEDRDALISVYPGDVIEIVDELLRIVAVINIWNKTARLEHAELWGVDSDFQSKIDKVLSESQ